jgi:hypothetical protein
VNLSTIAKPLAAALLALGVATAVAAPADAAPQSARSSMSDTAWE